MVGYPDAAPGDRARVQFARHPGGVAGLLPLRMLGPDPAPRSYLRQSSRAGPRAMWAMNFSPGFRKGMLGSPRTETDIAKWLVARLKYGRAPVCPFYAGLLTTTTSKPAESRGPQPRP